MEVIESYKNLSEAAAKCRELNKVKFEKRNSRYCVGRAEYFVIREGKVFNILKKERIIIRSSEKVEK